jgi:two-component system, response regulator / RNA-binding antiterminator
MADPVLRIMVVDENSVRATIIEEGLREAAFKDVIVVRELQNLLRKIVDVDPDVILIDLADANRDVLEQMLQVSRSVHRPVAMFVDHADANTIEAAVQAGVGTYVIDGLRKERVKSIVDMTISRFNAFNRLREELDRTKQALEDRKMIDRARGILMKQRSLTEDDAYSLMRKVAMQENRRMSQVAQSIVTAASLLR